MRKRGMDGKYESFHVAAKWVRLCFDWIIRKKWQKEQNILP